jgi:Leucine-rich repeat (LRR) protein
VTSVQNRVSAATDSPSSCLLSRVSRIPLKMLSNPPGSFPSPTSPRPADTHAHAHAHAHIVANQTQDLQLQHLRLKSSSLPLLRFPRFGPHLKRLCLRQNELTSPLPPDALEGLTQLEELDCYDNRLGPRVRDEEVRGCGNVT